MRILVAGLIAAGVVVAGAPHGAHAEADVHVKWMNCVLHPGQLDIVYIENTGASPQDLTGWELRSDGEGERMSLTPAGTIAPGQEIFATAGAHAVNLPGEDVFLWSNTEILRDSGEPPDYVRLLDASGNHVSGMDCNHNPVAAPAAPSTPSPTATPAAEAPTVQANPPSANTSTRPGASNSSVAVRPPSVSETVPGSVPLGGGPPGVSHGNAGLALIAGALLAALGVAVTIAGMGTQGVPAARPVEGSSRRCGN